ncbi:hypothetical protein LTR95_003432 [Oleoguttula sp. CCFEE 5521]
MAANIPEALEVGCKALLIDEDSSATNLLLRDHRMQLLIKHETITPLISNVRALYNEQGVSTVVVVGALGDWLAVADRVIAMDSYGPHVVTQHAEDIIRANPSTVFEAETYGSLPQRAVRIEKSEESHTGKPRRHTTLYRAPDKTMCTIHPKRHLASTYRASTSSSETDKASSLRHVSTALQKTPYRMPSK